MRTSLYGAAILSLLLAGCGETAPEAPATPEMDSLTSQIVNDPFGHLGGAGAEFVASTLAEDGANFSGTVTMKGTDGMELVYDCSGTLADGMAQEHTCAIAGTAAEPEAAGGPEAPAEAP